MVSFAPMSIPSERRLQTAAVAFWVTHYFVGLFISLCCLLIPFLWLPFIAYLVFIIHDETHERGGRPIQSFRKSSLWKHYCHFFPLELKKETDLDPSKTYIFGCHPHGIIALGPHGNLNTDGNDFSKLFPGINLRFGTLASNFKTPFTREILLALGFVSVEKKSIQNVLKMGPGSAIVIIVGGAAEALNARPGSHDLTLASRKGFVKIALENGANLVPVYSFGENEVFDQVRNEPGTPLRKIQEELKKILGFSLPIFNGRGIFNYDYGIIPKRKRIVTVVGKPIDLPKVASPSQEEIDKYHKLYCESLVALFHKHKDEYARDRKSDIRIL